MGTRRAWVGAALVALVLCSCGGASSASTSDTGEGAESWWVLDTPGFLLVDGGVPDGSRDDSTGERWSLEYSNGPQTVQFQAYAEDSTHGSLVRALPATGSITIDGVEATIRNGPAGAAGAAAEWSEGGLIVTFGGGALSEAELREFVTQVRRVSQADWDTAVASIPTVTASTDTTRLR